jgi:predicted nucleic acid-binding protein
VSQVLLDTSAYSAFLRGAVAVKERLQTADAIYLNPVVLGELWVGLLQGVDRDRG